MAEALLTFASVILYAGSVWWTGGAVGWNARERRRFEAEMADKGWAEEPDELPPWPGILAFALATLAAFMAAGL